MNPYGTPKRTTALVYIAHSETTCLYSLPGDFRDMNWLTLANQSEERALAEMWRCLGISATHDGYLAGVSGGALPGRYACPAPLMRWLTAPEFQGAPVILITILRSRCEAVSLGQAFALFVKHLYALDLPGAVGRVKGSVEPSPETLPLPPEAC